MQQFVWGNVHTTVVCASLSHSVSHKYSYITFSRSDNSREEKNKFFFSRFTLFAKAKISSVWKIKQRAASKRYSCASKLNNNIFIGDNKSYNRGVKAKWINKFLTEKLEKRSEIIVSKSFSKSWKFFDHHRHLSEIKIWRHH